MPIYEYECEACGHRFELIQKFSDPLVEVCPKCGERKVHKLLSSPAIKFKGSGWYVTDYAPKGSPGSDGPKTETAEKKAGEAGSSSTSTTTSASSSSSAADSAPSKTPATKTS